MLFGLVLGGLLTGVLDPHQRAEIFENALDGSGRVVGAGQELSEPANGRLQFGPGGQEPGPGGPGGNFEVHFRGQGGLRDKHLAVAVDRDGWGHVEGDPDPGRIVWVQGDLGDAPHPWCRRTAHRRRDSALRCS